MTGPIQITVTGPDGEPVEVQIVMAEIPTPKDWPPNFRCLEDGPGRWVVVNGNYDEEYATVVTDPVLACESAWDWWHDVKDQPRGRCDHDFSDPNIWRLLPEGVGGERICLKCGMGARQAWSDRLVAELKAEAAQNV